MTIRHKLIWLFGAILVLNAMMLTGLLGAMRDVRGVLRRSEVSHRQIVLASRLEAAVLTEAKEISEYLILPEDEHGTIDLQLSAARQTVDAAMTGLTAATRQWTELTVEADEALTISELQAILATLRQEGDACRAAARRGDRSRAVALFEHLSEEVVEDAFDDRIQDFIEDERDQVSEASGRLDTEIGRLGIMVLALPGFCLVLFGIVSFSIVRSVGGSVESLARGMRTVAEGDLDARLPADEADEVSRLIPWFNHMVDRLESMTVSRNQLEDLIDSVGDPLVVLDKDGDVVRINRAFTEVLGWSAADVVGKPPAASFRHPDGTYLAVDGHVVAVEETRTEIRGADGAGQGTVCIATDLREQIAREEALQEALERAEASSRAKSDFLATMSHEIRTPMNGVLGMAGILLAGDLEPEQRRRLEIIDTSGRNLLGIINDVLDFSKIEAGHMELHPAPFRPDTLVDAVREQCLVTATAKGLGLRVVIGPGTAMNHVGDAGRIRQVLINLVGNAIKFTTEGQVTIAVTADPEVGEVSFAVRDTGPGIPPDAIPTLFDKFTQVDSSPRRRHGGTGLGLAISDRLVRQMGGRITVESREGAGSVFRVTLPLAPAPDALDAASTPEAPFVAAPDADGSPPRVLVVDDNDVNALVASALLEEAGCAVEVFTDGESVLARLAAGPADLVLMDCEMPVLDGYETTRRIRDELKLEVPVAAFTANALAGDRERCLAAGMDDYVAKPVSDGELHTVLHRWLRAAPDPAPAAT